MGAVRRIDHDANRVKLYFAGMDGIAFYIALLQRHGIERVLVPFSAPPKNLYRAADAFPDVFLDSGAFTAFTTGREIDFDRYCDFIQTREWSAYASLDVIGNAQQTMRNADAMIERGLSPVVAFHYGSDYAVLDEMCRQFDRIALGGLVPIRMRRRELTRHLDRCFHIAGNHWPIRIHGFGMQQPWAMERWPFHSTDATSWLYGHTRSRMLMREDGKWRHQTRRVTREHAERQSRASLSYAVTVASVYSDDPADKLAATHRNIKTLLKVERDVTRLWAARGITWED